MFKTLLTYFDFWYFLRFTGLFALFYVTYTFVFSAAVPTGYYSPFIDHYLNFPALIRYGVLSLSHSLLSLFGYGSVIQEGRIISADGGSVLEMAWPCYGMGLKSFWVAFVCAHKLELKPKIWWSLLGVVTIFLLNCLRVTVLMIAMVDRWPIFQYLGANAHDTFNYLCYAALLGLVLLFYAKAKDLNYRSKISVAPTV